MLDIYFCESASIEGGGIVQVAIPWQGYDLIVEVAPIPQAAQMISTPYQYVTLVTNFKVFKSGEEKQVPWTKFSPLLLIRVEYTEEQWNLSSKNQGNNHGRPWLVYWDNEIQEWVEFDSVEIDPVDGKPESGGFLLIFVRQWEDPPIGIV
jgi:hypothetical protein